MLDKDKNQKYFLTIKIFQIIIYNIIQNKIAIIFNHFKYNKILRLKLQKNTQIIIKLLTSNKLFHRLIITSKISINLITLQLINRHLNYQKKSSYKNKMWKKTKQALKTNLEIKF